MTPLRDNDLKQRLEYCMKQENCILTSQCREKAELVLTEIMSRCRFNVEQIVSRLVAMGYVFRYPEQAHVFPLLDLDKRIEALEKHEETLPLSLRLWYELVGSANLMGTHPKWSPSAYSTSDSSDETELWYTDPLVVEDGLLDDAFDNWTFRSNSFRADVADDPGDNPCCIEVAPDEFHKANVSGGASYEMSLLQPVVDTILRNEPHNVDFVEYLRIAIGYGGFPGVAGIPEFPMNIIHDLRQGLLPF